MNRTQWLMLLAALLALMLGGRMVLRYCDYQASESGRQQQSTPPP